MHANSIHLPRSSANRLRRSLLLLAFIVPLLTCFGVGRADGPPGSLTEHDVSLIALIANPEKYQGKKVLVEGVAKLEFEDHSLYLSEADAVHVVVGNSVWLELGDPQRIPARYYDMAHGVNMRWVIVEGTFDMNDHGHLGLGVNGAIRDITRLQAIYVPGWADLAPKPE